MRLSQLFSQTLRQIPGEADVVSHQLLLRAGFIRQLAAGIFTYMPLAKRSMTKIENILREEMDAIGGQEMTMPVVHPAEVWQKTGRWYEIGSEMGRFKDKNNRDMVLAMTHEEVVADLVHKEIQSYRQLPQLIYHIQTKWRDDPRPRAGLIRVREFTMKDSYSLDKDWEGLDAQYRAHYQTYFNIYTRCGLPVKAVKSDVGMMGGKLAHEFMYLTPVGEDTLLLCDGCGYSANRQIATFQKPAATEEAPQPVESVATPDIKTIEALSEFLNIPQAKTAKAVFMMATVANDNDDVAEDAEDIEKFVFAIVRGDMELNETKLANGVKAKELRPATEDEIMAVGAVPGYASPVGLNNVFVVVDDAIPASPNLVAGANKDGYHLKNVNYGRDYAAAVVADIAAAQEGDACLKCGGPMQAVRGVEVGNIFKLGTRYSEAVNCTFLDQDGQEKPVIMGSYGIGVGRLLACVAEESHDKDGLIWPISIAPYQVHIVKVSEKGQQDRMAELADTLYKDLRSAGIEVLYDDRNEKPGVKFKDADLIGVPIRLTVSPRALANGGVECKLRHSPERTILPFEGIVSAIQQQIAALQQEITQQVIEVPLEEE
jgi:prolyl-tRNA synthetase